MKGIFRLKRMKYIIYIFLICLLIISCSSIDKEIKIESIGNHKNNKYDTLMFNER